MISQKSQYNEVSHQKYFTYQGMFGIILKIIFALFNNERLKSARYEIMKLCIKM